MTQTIRKIKKFFLKKAKLLWKTFKEKLELHKSYEQYKDNQQLAEILTRTFPAPIIQNVVSVGKKKVVQNFTPKNLREAYNDITYQISHRRLKLTTKFDWSLKATRLFENYIMEQTQTS